MHDIIRDLIAALVALGLGYMQVVTIRHLLGVREKVETVKEKVEVMKENVEKIEKETNSMKDALIVATEKEALLRGATEEKARADEAAQHGKLEGKRRL